MAISGVSVAVICCQTHCRGRNLPVAGLQLKKKLKTKLCTDA